MQQKLGGPAFILKTTLAAALLGLIACSKSEAPPSPGPLPAPASPVAQPPAPAVAQPAVAQPSAPPPVAPFEPAMPVPSPQRDQVPYLDPDEFPEAPPELRQALKDLGCRIPQTTDPDFPESDEYFEPGNLVSGYFKSTAELHWAVFCSRNYQTTLLLFDDLGHLEDQFGGPQEDDGYGYLDYIDVADREHIFDDHQSFGGNDTPPLPPIFHEGLESGVSEKGSWIYYWHNCQWLELQGGD